MANSTQLKSQALTMLYKMKKKKEILFKEDSKLSNENKKDISRMRNKYYKEWMKMVNAKLKLMREAQAKEPKKEVKKEVKMKNNKSAKEQMADIIKARNDIK